MVVSFECILPPNLVITSAEDSLYDIGLYPGMANGGSAKTPVVINFRKSTVGLAEDLPIHHALGAGKLSEFLEKNFTTQRGVYNFVDHPPPPCPLPQPLIREPEPTES